MRKLIVFSSPRTGSTAVMQLLGSHPQIINYGELLNPTMHFLPEKLNDRLEYLNIKISEETQIRDDLIASFKVHTCDLDGLTAQQIMHHCDITYALIVWRKNTVESIASAKIAKQTGVWYLDKDSAKNATSSSSTAEIDSEKRIDKCVLDISELKLKLEKDYGLWKQLFKKWPFEIVPIFVQYEWLFRDDDPEALSSRFDTVYAQLGLTNSDKPAGCFGIRQNPASLEEKVHCLTELWILNWHALPMDLRNYQLDVPNLFKQSKQMRTYLPTNLFELLPDPEPRIEGENSSIVRVSQPYIPKEAIAFVNEAMETKNISSASIWPQRMSSRLESIYGVPIALPCSNGFTALVLALQAAAVGPNCDVIVPSFTMVAVCNAVLFVGANPIFVDSSSHHQDYNPNWAQMESAITLMTKAIIITHTYGCPAADTEIIARECQQRGYILIEDISECVGIQIRTADGNVRLLGTFGDFACASMYANKIVHSGDGGFVLTRNKMLGTRLKSLLNHGFTKNFHFVHFEMAINGKINGLGAAMACGLLDKLEFIMEHRDQLASWYRSGLAELFETKFLAPMPACGTPDTPWVFGVLCRNKAERTALRNHLAQAGIETRDFFFPLHLQPLFKGKYVDLNLENAQKLGSLGFYLPTHTNLTKKIVGKIVNEIFTYFGQNRLSTENITTINEEEQNKKICISAEQNKNTAAKGCAYQLLKKCSQCLLDSAETWDERHELTEAISEYLANGSNEHSQKSPLLLQNELRAFQKYFHSTMNSFDNARQKFGATDERTFFRASFLKWIQTVNSTMSPNDFGNKTIVGRTLLIISSENNDEICGKKYNIDNIVEGGWQCQKQIIHVNAIVDDSIWEMHKFEKYAPFSKDAEIYFVVLDLQSPINLDNCNEKATKMDSILWYLLYHNVHSVFVAESCQTIDWLNFLTKLSNKFTLIAKANSGRYMERIVNPEMECGRHIEWEQVQTLWNRPLPKKFHFVAGPEWTHHQGNVFDMAIIALKDVLHADHSNVLFIPAVEQYICDSEKTPTKSWVGIIHSTIHNEDQFYVPDLEQFVKKMRFKSWLKNCIGLFTLTNSQKDFLEQNLRPTFAFPINQIFYPAAPIQKTSIDNSISNAVEVLPTDIYCIGAFNRDFEYFFTAILPNKHKKLLLVPTNSDIPIELIPSNVDVRQRVNQEEYETILSKCIVFLALKSDGAASTLLIECIGARAINEWCKYGRLMNGANMGD